MTKVFGARIRRSGTRRSAVERGARRDGGPRARADRLRRHGDPLRRRRRHLRRPANGERAGSAAGRAGRLHRLPGALRSEVRQPGDHRRERRRERPERQPITDQFGQPGFPGFDGLFATHDARRTSRRCRRPASRSRSATSRTRTTSTGSPARSTSPTGPGEAGYVEQLKAYDQAFAKFFDRLAADGINKNNTLFVFTIEEGDHFVGSQPTPAGCDGVNDAVLVQHGQRDQRQPGRPARDAAGDHDAVHGPLRHGADDLHHRQPGSDGRRHPRTSGGRSGSSTAVNPYHRGRPTTLSVALADPVGMKALHMITADPQRTPTLTMFADPGLLPVRGGAELRVAVHLHPAAEQLHVRLEPRRHRARDRDDVARHGRAGRSQPRAGRHDLGRPHRRPADDAQPARARGHATSTTGACSSTSSTPGRCRSRCAPTARRCGGSARSTSS